ncbi:18788_t:CDS:2, partial [Racocetra fulgida]
MLAGKFSRQPGVHEVAIKSIESSPYNVSDEIKTSEIFREAANGLKTIHSAGLIHRDFHTGNILVELPFPKEAHDDFYLSVAICNGERPQTAKNVTIPECYNELMEQCWNNIPSNRPSVNELYEVLRGWRFAGISANQFEDANKNYKDIKIIDQPKQQPPN